jgi:hypothetical protein
MNLSLYHNFLNVSIIPVGINPMQMNEALMGAMMFQPLSPFQLLVGLNMGWL